LHVQGIQLKVKHSTSSFLTLEAGSSSYQNILEFSDGGASGAFIYDHPSNYLATKVNGSEAMRIDSSRNVLLGTTGLPNGTSIYGSAFRKDTNQLRMQLYMASNSTTNRYMILFFNPNGQVGNIATDGSATQYNTSSDYRLKENVVEITGATERLKQLSPKRFNFIADANKTVDGFLAHEVSNIVPEAISGTKDEVDADGNPVYQGIDQSKLVPLLVASLKEALTEIDNLKARVNTLEDN